jgi:hypothetical protein
MKLRKATLDVMPGKEQEIELDPRTLRDLPPRKGSRPKTLGGPLHIQCSGREFARVLLGAPTIHLALPLVCAHWAIVRGWAEPHYLGSFGLLPAGVVVVYTPEDREQLSVCYALFHAAYHSAFAMNRRPCSNRIVRGEIPLVPGTGNQCRGLDRGHEFAEFSGEVMNRRFKVQPTKTLSDHPLLIGEILQRSDLGNLRKAKLRACLRKLTEISIRALRLPE